MKRFALFSLTLLFLAACTPTAEPPAADAVLVAETAVSKPTTLPQPVVKVDTPRIDPATAVPIPTQSPVEATKEPPTTVPVPTVEEAVAEINVVNGRTEEGAFFMGDPDAPIVHLDYSDFL